MKKSKNHLLETYKKCQTKVLKALKSTSSTKICSEIPTSRKYLHHAETTQSTRIANKLTGCNKTQAQNQRKLQNSPEYHEDLQSHIIN